MTHTGPPAVWWTGREATALRRAMCLTAERFAARVGVTTRTVASWGANPAMVPRVAVQQRLDAALHDATPLEQARFRSLAGGPAPRVDLADAVAAFLEAGQRLTELMEAM